MKETARSQYPCRLAQGSAVVGHVHHRHESRRKIERACSERQIGRVGDYVSDAERFGFFRIMRVSDEGRRDIDGMHPGPKSHKLAGVRPFAAANIESAKTTDRR